MERSFLGEIRVTRGFTQAVIVIFIFFTGFFAVADPLVKSGDKIAFLGSSTTEGGLRPGGYVTLTILGLKVAGIEATAINAGQGGNTTRKMLERLDGDVISKKPDVLVLNCGDDDAWSGWTGPSPLLEEFKASATKIVETAQAANIKVVIVTAPKLYRNSERMIPFNDFLRTLAAEKKCPFADTYGPFQESLKANPYSPLKLDNFNAEDSTFIAKGILKALGLNDEQMAKTEKAMLDQPDTFECDSALKMGFTLRQIKLLDEIAAKNNMPTDQMISLLFASDLFTDAPIKTVADIESFLNAQRGKDVWKEMQDRLNKRLNTLMTGKE